MLSLGDVKQHLRIDLSDDSQDCVLQLYIDAAATHVENYCERKFGNDAPAPVKAGALLLIGDLYEHRESVTQSSISEIPTMARLLAPYRDYSGRFSPRLIDWIFDTTHTPIIVGDQAVLTFKSFRDLSGKTVEALLHKNSELILTKNCVITNATNGDYEYRMTAAETATLSTGRYWIATRIAGAAPETLQRTLVDVVML
jgi:uncharacterized phage protein (predicted DNA packaging)